MLYFAFLGFLFVLYPHLRFAHPQGFPRLRSDITGTIEVPDGDWQLSLDAPYGGVKGSISTTAGTAVRVDTVLGSSAVTTLLTFGGCMVADSLNGTDCGKASPKIVSQSKRTLPSDLRNDRHSIDLEVRHRHS